MLHKKYYLLYQFIFLWILSIIFIAFVSNNVKTSILVSICSFSIFICVYVFKKEIYLFGDFNEPGFVIAYKLFNSMDISTEVNIVFTIYSRHNIDELLYLRLEVNNKKEALKLIKNLENKTNKEKLYFIYLHLNNQMIEKLFSINYFKDMMFNEKRKNKLKKFV
jgi:hypothetical protein